MTRLICSICDKPILDSDVYIVRKKRKDGSYDEETRKNIAVSCKGTPTGYVHLLCKVRYDESILGNGRITQNLEGMANEL